MKKMELRQKNYLKRICSLLCIFTLIIQPVGFATSFEDTVNITQNVQDWASNELEKVEENLEEDIETDTEEVLGKDIEETFEDSEILGIIDINPPEFVSLKVNGESVEIGEELEISIEAPGILKFEVEASDDISGVEDGYIVFRDKITEKRLQLNLRNYRYNESTGNREDLEAGWLAGEINLSKYTNPGKYEINNMRFWDKADNDKNYVQNPSEWELERGYEEIPIDFRNQCNQQR